MDWKIVLVCFLPEFREDWMVCRCKDAVWPQHRMIANINVSVIYAGQAKVGINIVAQMQVPPTPVCMEGRLDPAALSAFCKHCVKQLSAFFFFGWAGGIVIIQTFHTMFLLRQKSRIVWIINFLAVKKAVTHRKTLLYFS